MAEALKNPSISFDVEPARYRHWKLTFDGPVATLSMNVKEDAGLLPDYQLKLNSYDLGVDVELNDAVERIRFEHPEVRCVVVTSLKEKLFCAGANIFMLGISSHAWKVNFCKFTNETRLGIEDASKTSGIKFLAALNGIAAGGGYELALACDEIFLVDDGASAVSLPEVPLLGVLPGTGGLTRVVDKRKVRRDLADVFCTSQEGVRGERAVQWRLIDKSVPRSRFGEAVQARAKELAAPGPRGKQGIALPYVAPRIEADEWKYRHVTVALDRARRIGRLTVRAPEGQPPESIEGIEKAGADFWPLRAFRELDDAILRLRIHEPEIGLVELRATGDHAAVLAVDATLQRHRGHWLVREILAKMARVLKRVDVSSKTFYAIADSKESCFAGSLLELALAADRVYALDAGDDVRFAISGVNGGELPMWNGLSRLQTRFLGEDPRALMEGLLQHTKPFSTQKALELGLVTFAPDEIDWEDEVRLAVEERASMSPDALTGMEANLRWPGPETMATKIFGRLSAWQNWIFQRPNAVGERGALKVYGKQGQKPEFDWRRV